MQEMIRKNPLGIDYINFIQESFGLLEGHEQTKVVGWENIASEYPDTTYYWNEKKTTPCSMPVAICRRENGKLQITTTDLTHMLVIGATGSGKTQLIMMILEYFRRECEKGKGKNSPSFCISDPKNELYKKFGPILKKHFNVICMNFVEYEKSVHWNPLAKIYKLHKKYREIETTVEAIVEDGECKNKFRGVIYEDQLSLDAAVAKACKNAWAEMSVEIENIAKRICPTINKNEPTWEDGARDTFKALIYGMIEDEVPLAQFNFNTMLEIFDRFGGDDGYDGGYFSDRDHEKSDAYKLASRYVLLDARQTRDGFMSTLSSMLNIIRDPAIRTITSDSSFEPAIFDDDCKPTIVFLTYPDETKTYGGIISLYLSSLYTDLTKMVRLNGDVPRKNPFIFLLDEFGNLPEFPDFSTSISAARARNIWFWIVLQSYAQLNSVYGQNQAKIIKDNLNQKIFLGTNDRETAEEFSKECGQYTRISPSSVLAGDDGRVQYKTETIPVITVSRLSQLAIGECVVKRMNAPVLISRFERHYLCTEFDVEPEEEEKSGGVEHVSAAPRRAAEKPTSPSKKEYVESLETLFTGIISESEYVSTALIQIKLNVPYTVAKELIGCAQKRGWIIIDPRKANYAVNREKIKEGLLFMPKNVAEAILAKFEDGQLAVLEYISDRHAVGFEELDGFVGKLDKDINLKQTLSFFCAMRLISRIDGVYVANVAKDCTEYFKMLYPDVRRKKRFDFEF